MIAYRHAASLAEAESPAKSRGPLIQARSEDSVFRANGQRLPTVIIIYGGGKGGLSLSAAGHFAVIY